MIKKHLHTFGIIAILAISTLVIAGIVVLIVTKPSPAETPAITPGTEQPASDDQPSNISLNNLSQGQVITGELVATGTVKGWFFEGSFPVVVRDASGNQLALALATTTESWMTADPLPFSVAIPDVTYTGPGTITFVKDNPSGLPENDESYTVNVVFQ